MRNVVHLGLIILIFLPLNLFSAEIYQYVDSSGTLHFTNVPTDPRFKRILPEQSDNTAFYSVGREEIEVLIDQASRTQQVSPALVKAVIRAESNFKVNALSPSGAQGLMQLMPATAEDLKLGNPFDPEENIQGGTRYLRFLLDRFNQDIRLAIAAYHAGPGTVSRYGGVPPIKKTSDYLNKVLHYYESYLNKPGKDFIRTTNNANPLKKEVFAQSRISSQSR